MMSSSMMVSLGSVGLVRSTSSANLRFVMVDAFVGLSSTPVWSRCHLITNGAMMYCRRALKSKELSESPCLVPRFKAKGRLSTLIRAVAVWLV